VRSAFRRLVPLRLVRLYRRARLILSRRRNRNRPVQEVFTGIYRENQWGGRPGQFFSGSGSVGSQASLYVDVVRTFIKEKGISKVIDLGCGDFAVGGRLLISDVRYIGVDVVPALIQRNLDKFGSPNVSFQCLDIISDDLPNGDLCLIRQVFQHLSNAQIAKVIAKLTKYDYVIITEHYPAPGVRVVPNKDKPHGADIRVYDASGVYLDLPPFNMRVSSLLLEVEAGADLVDSGEVIRTFLVHNR